MTQTRRESLTALPGTNASSVLGPGRSRIWSMWFHLPSHWEFGFAIATDILRWV
jgi:hypothetical protein